MNKLYYYAKSECVDYIMLDHLSLVISSSDGIQNERKDIDSLMTKLAAMVVETGVGLLQVVHLKRSSGDKSFAKGGEVEVPNAPKEPDERIDKMTGQPYNIQAGSAFVDEEDPDKNLI